MPKAENPTKTKFTRRNPGSSEGLRDFQYLFNSRAFPIWNGGKHFSSSISSTSGVQPYLLSRGEPIAKEIETKKTEAYNNENHLQLVEMQTSPLDQIAW